MQGTRDEAGNNHLIDQKQNMRPDYDSGWISIGAGVTSVITHGLGGDQDKFIIKILLKDSIYGVGIHHLGYGAFYDTGWYGFYWSNLTSTQISMNRQPLDIYSQQFRVQIWRNQWQ